jgi:tetratricopeptide (TPR) repeat protein
MNQSDRLTLTKCIQNAQTAINIGNFREAEKCFTEAITRAQNIDPGLYILVLYSLATFYCTQKNYDEAERLYKECIPLNEQALFPFHYYLAELYTDVGITLLAAERYDDAKEYFEEALERLDKPNVLGELSIRINKVLLKLSKVHLAHQNFDEAEACVKRTIAYAEKELLEGKKNLRSLYESALAARQHELCKVFLAQKRYKEAEDLCKLVLDTTEKLQDYVSPPVFAETLFTMADIHDAQKREAESKALRKRANDLMETWFEPEQSAFEYELERCIECCLRALKDDAALAQIFELQIAMQARQDFSMGRHSQAEQCFKRLLKTKEELVGPYHLDILEHLDMIVALTLKQKNMLRQKQFVCVNCKSPKTISVRTTSLSQIN